MRTIKFGFKPDTEDERDFKYASHPEFKICPALPTQVSLLSKMSDVEDQGLLGSCVANATCAALEFLQLNSPLNFGKYAELSRLFVYYNARVIDGGDIIDTGTSIRSAIKSIKKYGICRELLWPYVESQVSIKPDDSSYAEGLKHQVLAGYRVDVTLLSMKQCLANGYPFVFGVNLYDSFMSKDTESTGIVPMPDRELEACLGGHAMTAIGYDDMNNRFLVRNSWGTSWGVKGMCTIPYAYLTNTELCLDVWTLRMD